MGRRERKDKKSGESKGRRDSGQEDLVNNLMEEVRTIDSEIDLLKQKVNAIIRQINVLKRVVLSEKKDIKDLQAEQDLEKSRFESMIEIVKGLKK